MQYAFRESKIIPKLTIQPQLLCHCIIHVQYMYVGTVSYVYIINIFNFRSIPTLIKFFAIGESLHLDGFVFELPGEEFGKDTESFGEGVRRVLSYMSEQDPAGFIA